MLNKIYFAADVLRYSSIDVSAVVNDAAVDVISLLYLRVLSQ
jgi:hypothetical protein